MKQYSIQRFFSSSFWTSGDVTPALMNPLSQLHSIPLAEGICHAISDMNADHVMVTQETLMEQLVKNYPGIAAPSHDILYKILGTLIKERKIYHTGGGYFIVTPNTYFTTNDATEDNRRVLIENSCCCSSPSITYLVNIKCCAHLGKEKMPTVSHYRSCHCFPDQNMLCEQRQPQPMNHGPNDRVKKGCSELKPSTQTQGISTSAENTVWDTIKSLTSVKEKLKSKRFGLGLFWRGASIKGKCKEEYSTFSAQFPPKEWPVRDEDDLGNIPRDIEHEIIKRINPTLTVDNLVKHTILMQKLEEQKKYFVKGTSAEVSTVRQKHLQKNTPKDARKTKPKKEQQISGSKRKSHVHELPSQNEKPDENLSLPFRSQQPSDVAVESHVIYKKQIKNPFQGLSWRHNFNAKGYKGTINSQLRSRTRKQERALQRPQSLDSSITFDYETEELATEMQADKAKQYELLHTNRSPLQLKKVSSGNFSYLQSSTLHIDNRGEYFGESNISEENIYRKTVKKNPRENRKYPDSCTEGNDLCKEDAKMPLHRKDECGRCKADTVCELLDQTANEFQNVSLSNYTANGNLARDTDGKYRRKTDKKGELMFKNDSASCSGSMKLENEGFLGNCCHQGARDGYTCNSLYLNDNFEGNKPSHPPPGHTLSYKADWSKAVKKVGTAVFPKNCKVNTYPAQHNSTVRKCGSGEHRYKESADFAELVDVSKVHPKPNFTKEGLCSQTLPTGHRKEKTGLTEHPKASAVADFCPANEADLDADTLQNVSYEMGEAVACCALGSQTKGTRNVVGKKDLIFNNACTVISGQKHSEGTENHSITGDSGIDSPRWTEKKMKLPAKF
ncbi:storkhead-box protein 1 [Colius striatus]|uniref:storkhead-box protein 1 n=1 Tax=Colius striatus TaxID=57412 RepID=UPI002B1E3EE2|nr:storkhead-box protein 1 [Colius striatus]